VVSIKLTKGHDIRQNRTHLLVKAQESTERAIRIVPPAEKEENVLGRYSLWIKRFQLFSCTLAVILVGLSACNQAASTSQNPITIGLSVSVAGDFAAVPGLRYKDTSSGRTLSTRMVVFLGVRSNWSRSMTTVRQSVSRPTMSISLPLIMSISRWDHFLRC
jgi:hypothetical protein